MGHSPWAKPHIHSSTPFAAMVTACYSLYFHIHQTRALSGQGMEGWTGACGECVCVVIVVSVYMCVMLGVGWVCSGVVSGV